MPFVSEAHFLLGVLDIPRPSSVPGFDHLQYVNTEGEGLGDLDMQ